MVAWGSSVGGAGAGSPRGTLGTRGRPSHRSQGPEAPADEGWGPANLPAGDVAGPVSGPTRDRSPVCPGGLPGAAEQRSSAGGAGGAEPGSTSPQSPIGAPRAATAGPPAPAAALSARGPPLAADAGTAPGPAAGATPPPPSARWPARPSLPSGGFGRRQIGDDRRRPPPPAGRPARTGGGEGAGAPRQPRGDARAVLERATVRALGADARAPCSGHSRKGTSLTSVMRHLKQNPAARRRLSSA